MSYRVLARKWRPQSFAETVGQEHVLRALVNALDQQLLHHAYLFSGTRGVGKTTIGRIFAKCLNCEEGVSSTPCGRCNPCQEVMAGRFVDLIEIDAASRTKVDDMRELLDNVQYLPASGRYKIYLIDEVHMLSLSSFNALLKTLEEPPPHVKFLLATTDPQKLPVTILSRCLQFNLKSIPPKTIVQHLEHILAEEKIPAESPALWLLAEAAGGSLRDSLSLLDQAIAYGNQTVVESDVAAMLGTMDRQALFRLLDGLSASDGKAILAEIDSLAMLGVDFDGLLARLMALIHRVALAQAVGGYVDESQGDEERVRAFADSISPEDIQLFYQIGLMGRKDLPLAPDLRVGVEMTLLRMLAFRPAVGGQKKNPVSPGKPLAKPATNLAGQTDTRVMPRATLPEAAQTKAARTEAAQTEAAQTEAVKVAAAEAEKPAKADWTAWVTSLALSGMARNLAANAALASVSDTEVELLTDPDHGRLWTDRHYEHLATALSKMLERKVRVKVSVSDEVQETPAKRWERDRQARVADAVDSLKSDPNVRFLVEQFDGRLEEASVEPL